MNLFLSDRFYLCLHLIIKIIHSIFDYKNNIINEYKTIEIRESNLFELQQF